MFKNRIEAGIALAGKLEKYSTKEAVILAIPRGGVPVGFVVAKKTGLPLDLLLTKKIGHPKNREFAIGAVSLTDSYLLPYNGIPSGYINAETESIRKRLKEMRVKFVGDAKPLSLTNKTVIIVDDGAATGNTILSSISMIQKHAPERIVVAVPVASRSAASKLSRMVDEFVSILTSDEFNGVGDFYEDFHPVKDEEVRYYLHLLEAKSQPALNKLISNHTR